MSAKQIIVIFVLGLIVGYTGHYLLSKVDKSDYDNKTDSLNQRIVCYLDTIAQLTADNKQRDSYILDLENHIQFQEDTIGKLHQSHDKKVSSIRFLTPDENIRLLGANLSEVHTAGN